MPELRNGGTLVTVSTPSSKQYIAHSTPAHASSQNSRKRCRSYEEVEIRDAPTKSKEKPSDRSYEEGEIGDAPTKSKKPSDAAKASAPILQDDRSPSPACQELMRSETQWFDDGNVEIQTKNLVFRLFYGRLIRQSLALKDLLVKKSDTMLRDEGGRPIIYIDGDGYELQALLDVLDSGLNYSYSRLPFPVLWSIFPPAWSLRFPSVQAFARQSLKEMWPSSLDLIGSEPIMNAAGTVYLARTYGINGVLKRALYELLRSTSFTQPDSNILLPAAEIFLLARAREHVQRQWIPVLHKFHRFKCSHPRSGLLPSASSEDDLLTLEMEDTQRCLLDPLFVAHDMILKKSHVSQVCSDCAAKKEDILRKARATLWDDLDELFDVSPRVPVHD
ncbi:hypothetical protein EIP91_005015 [Steccherinum ochraceum]|uniref:BTB domain-containing protein n=1 Tax=Steccherinum ochraceum TaxID=92696 RepID=A0A4R0R7S9_9APHY|nr:hypothetical protein EIP91_005015 [Steccherinum ochraceum]